MARSITITGLNGLVQKFTSTAKNMETIVGNEVESMAQEWVAKAVNDAPADQGGLRGKITYYMKDKLTAEIVAQVFYAPYMEFGTKGNYRPIPGTEQIAAQFKGGKGGDFMQLLRMIARWVKRKGISGVYSVRTRRRTGSRINQLAEDYSAAWPIAMSILKNGIKPHPYFFKQQAIVWPQMIRQIQRALEKQTGVSVQLPANINRPRITTI